MTVPLGVICATRDRPDNATRLARQCFRTMNPQFTKVHFVIDGDDPARGRYCEELKPWVSSGWMEILGVHNGPHAPRRLGPVLNWASGFLAAEHEFLAFLGDDHYPKTPGWDETLCRALGGRPGVAYGNDLLQRENLPTACVISADLIRVLGYMCPKPDGPLHLFLDDWWKVLGLAVGNLVYRPDVIIEHLHPAAGKAPVDANYLKSGMSSALMRDDKQRWDAWREHVWPGDLKRLQEALGVTA